MSLSREINLMSKIFIEFYRALSTTFAFTPNQYSKPCFIFYRACQPARHLSSLAGIHYPSMNRLSFWVCPRPRVMTNTTVSALRGAQINLLTVQRIDSGLISVCACFQTWNGRRPFVTCWSIRTLWSYWRRTARRACSTWSLSSESSQHTHMQTRTCVHTRTHACTHSDTDCQSGS